MLGLEKGVVFYVKQVVVGSNYCNIKKHFQMLGTHAIWNTSLVFEDLHWGGISYQVLWEKEAK